MTDAYTNGSLLIVCPSCYGTNSDTSEITLYEGLSYRDDIGDGETYCESFAEVSATVFADCECTLITDQWSIPLPTIAWYCGDCGDPYKTSQEANACCATEEEGE